MQELNLVNVNLILINNQLQLNQIHIILIKYLIKMHNKYNIIYI